MHELGKRAAVCLMLGAAVGGSAPLHAAPNPKIERGKYLVERASMCGDCHTPMTAKGEPDMSRWLQGSMLFFTPKMPVPNWADYAPPLAGLAGLTDAQVLQVLQKGSLDGRPLRPPMPHFRFNQQDAEAIVAYLRSLQPPTGAPAQRR